MNAQIINQIVRYALIAWVVFVCLWTAYTMGKSGVENEAVKKGYAEFYIDQNNDRKWRWK